MVNYRYDMVIATIECNVKGHPKDQMKKLGAKIIKAEPWSLTNSWYFRVEHPIRDAPEYLFLLSSTFKFKDE